MGRRKKTDEEIREYHKKYYREHKEHLLAQMAIYREANAERIKANKKYNSKKNKRLRALKKLNLQTMEKLSKKTVLFIDLDGTLIKTVSGKTFPEDCTDFRIRKEVLDKITKVFTKLEVIGIVTNQGGIPEYVSIHDFWAKFQSIMQFLRAYFVGKQQDGIPDVDGWYCTSTDKDDPLRKPNVGMLERILADFPNKPSKEKMVMIGDASGKPGQFSDSDKKCAENFGIDYIDVEDFINL
jgi:DNA 3'-phosphatase